MKPRFSDYPIGKLLLDVMARSGLAPKDFFAELGYSNFSKVMASLDGWLEWGEGNALLLDRIQASRFAVGSDQLAVVMAANDVQMQQRRADEAKREEDEVRKCFHPFIEVIPELSRPTQITLYCVTGGNGRFNTRLPDDISTWSWEDQLTYVKKIVKENFAKHEGRTFFRGLIKGYLYHPTFDDEPIRLTITGDVDTSDKPDANTGCTYLMMNKHCLFFEQGTGSPSKK